MHLANKRTPVKHSEGAASVDFLNKVRLTLYKDSWGMEIDYKTLILSIPVAEMPKLEELRGGAKNEREITTYRCRKCR